VNLHLDGKRALVSGSTAGIGRPIATRLAEEEAQVIISGRREPAVNAAVAGIRAATGGEVIGFAADLTLLETVEELVRRHPKVDILIDNLAILAPKPFEAIRDEDWLRFST
jgi:NAD(P)-dependent dehydrogenase (short-subunit alcohol dehydrogenase family)